MSFSCIFENKVLNGLNDCGVDISSLEKSDKSIGVAVSGGADSISLLFSLSNLFKNKNIKIKVITVNHNIRAEEETKGDADFVVDFCKKMQSCGKNIECKLYEIERGKIFNLAEKNKAGIEEAARQLRYEAFEDFIASEKISFLCLAHNQNDKLETILMRFLQGASCDSAAGIPEVRDLYIRPLINITRNEIEDYLKENKINWRTDKTNFENNYFRNNIRNNLVPLLNNNFSGWQKAVLYGSEKNEMDSKIIDSILKKIDLDVNNQEVSFSRAMFASQMDGIKIRVLLKAFNLAGINQRIPFVFLNDVIKSEKESKEFYKEFSDVTIFIKKDIVLIKKSLKKTTELYFSDIIEESCNMQFPFGNLCIQNKGDFITFENNHQKVDIKCKFPLRIRSFYLGDEIETSSGIMKKLSDVYSDWHVDEEKKYLIPVIEELNRKDNRIVCILGSFLGFKDWVVK
ncbi:MAG: tRNA lysidine(34) synthetase TilS [Treponema sp.]|nr:tRNA lysidine(34) synthetase TilS [Treponema sp.]